MKLAAIAIVITVALSSAAALAQPGETSDQVPTFDINRNCRAEAADAATSFQQEEADCVRDEANAKKQLGQEWSKLGPNKRDCIVESSIGGDQSYVELLTCLEMSSPQWNGAEDRAASNAEPH